MVKFKYISYAAAVALVITASSCKKLLQESNLSSSTVENTYTTPDGFTTLVNMAYQDLHEFYGNEDGEFECETGTDLWYLAGRGTYAAQYMNYNNLIPTQGQGTKAWQYAYRSVNWCNVGISYIDKAGFTEPLRSQRLAELRFLRALYYYHIVEQFGNVVLRTAPSTDGVSVTDTRSPQTAFYDLMISDLQFAKDNLPVKWADAEYSRASKKSAAGLLARVYLTRAYYSTGADAQTWFGKARDAALDVINNQSTYGVSLYPTYAAVGQSVYGSSANRVANKEAMFVVSYSETNAAFNSTNGANGNRIFKYGLTKYTGMPGMLTTFVNAYGVCNESRLMPTWHFLDLFDETIDSRYYANFQEVWTANTAYTIANGDTAKYSLDPSVVGKSIAVGDTSMYCTKSALPYDRRFHKFIAVGRNDLYVNPQPKQPAPFVNGTIITQFYPSFKKWVNQNRTTTANTDYGDAMVIRLAEMYLIAAEAYVNLNDQANAAKYINVIRTRAAIPGNEAAMQITDPSKVDINFILDERARELAGEQQRWYDLKRVYHDQTAWAAYIQKWNPDIQYIQPTHWLRPIPQAELDAILNASEFGQNPGY